MIEGIIKEGHGRYLIPSESEPGTLRLVDLFSDGGPKCSCPDFGIRVEARHEKEECKHIGMAYEVFGREVADAARATLKKKSDPFG
jgi:uncharacterized protein YbaA (DUF1428 family)